MRRWGRRLVWVAIGVGLLAGAGAVYQAVGERRDLARFAPPGVLVGVGGGRRLHLICRGSGAPAVIFEASGLGTYRDWERVLPEVARVTRACAYDRAGLGWSDAGPLPRDARRLGDDLAALIARAPIEGPLVLVGHSAGGLVVRLYAQEHPDLVKGLVLVDTAPADLRHEMPDVYARMLRSARLAQVAARLGLLRLFNPFGISGEDRALTYRPQVFDATRSKAIFLEAYLTFPSSLSLFSMAG